MVDVCAHDECKFPFDDAVGETLPLASGPVTRAPAAFGVESADKWSANLGSTRKKPV
jgi:hypothetical protein